MSYEDLRQGRLDIVPNYYRVDLPFYQRYLKDFLPERFIDIHTHAEPLKDYSAGLPEMKDWPKQIHYGHYMSVSRLLEALLVLFPGKEVTPNILGGGTRETVDQIQQWQIQQLEDYPHIYGFMREIPDWSEKELIERFERGRFTGLKPYLNLAPAHIPVRDITIFDFVPRHHLKVAEERGWLIMLHIPRAERLADPVNVDQLKEIADSFPKVKIILPHIGRAYCPRFVDQGFKMLGETAKFYYWDFSANLLEYAMQVLIEHLPAERILYGSDLPILCARSKRICEGDNYINVMRDADWQDSHTRLAGPEERDQITFMIYEQIAAFRRAAEKKGLSKLKIEQIFYLNALRLLSGVNR